MTAYTRKALHDKRAKLFREIVQLEKRTRELCADLAHVETAIRFLWPGEEMSKILPHRTERRPRYFKRGALAKLIFDYMREHADDAVCIADMMPLVTADRSLNAA